MNIERDKNGDFNFGDVDPQLAQLFLAIPAATDPEGNPEVLKRLYPRPTEMSEPALNEEWAQFVMPELREAFESAASIVEADLEPLRNGGTGWMIRRDHMDAWVNALNQARLALAAKHGVTEQDMDRTSLFPGEDEKGVAVMQIHVYGLLQECLVRYLE